MRVEVLMPKFGMTMETGVVSEWLKKDGETVVLDDSVATIESDKIVNEAKAPAAGVFHPTAELMDDIPCGQPIGYIEA